MIDPLPSPVTADVLAVLELADNANPAAVRRQLHLIGADALADDLAALGTDLAMVDALKADDPRAVLETIIGTAVAGPAYELAEWADTEAALLWADVTTRATRLAAAISHAGCETVGA